MNSVQVFVRTRPLLPQESVNVVEVSDTTTSINLLMRRQSLFQSPDAPLIDHKKTFQFDGCVGPLASVDSVDHSQTQLYEKVGPQVVQAAFDGYNSCVFAYGMTSSGKSYSMTGTQTNPGTIPRLCKDLFYKAQNSDVCFEVTYMEIYNERVRDLLQRKQLGQHFRVREHPVEGPYVEGLARVQVQSFEELQKVLDDGNSHRTVASTHMNASSSRSHALFTIHIKQKITAQGHVAERVSKISLVDLAGSERQSLSRTTGDRLKEGNNINKSLSALGLVITALVERSRLAASVNDRKVFVPYRDSVLTWLLRTSLGGNSKTIMIATISPALEHADESLSTLRYATKAKEIVNVPVVNEDKTTRIIRDLTNEVERLTMRLKDLEGSAKESNELESLKRELADSQLAMGEIQSKLIQQVVSQSESVKSGTGSVYSEDTFKSVQLPMITDRQSTKNFPYMVSLDEDDIADSTLYLLQQQLIRLGSDYDQDIVLDGDQIESQHAIITVDKDDSVWLEPASQDLLDEDILRNLPQSELKLVIQPAIYINGTRLVTRTRLRHGLRILFGRSHLFRFYNRKEAKALKDSRRVSKHTRSDSFASVDNFGYSSTGSEESTIWSRSSAYQPDTPQVRRHSLLQTRSYVPFNTEDHVEEQESFESILSSDMMQMEQNQLKDFLAEADLTQSGNWETKRNLQIPLSDVATEANSSFAVHEPIVESTSSVLPNYPSVYSNVIADIPYVEEMDVEKPYQVYHIYITISFHSTNSRTGALETLPLKEKWLVQRRFSELYAYYKSVRYMLPPVLKSAFPKPGVWSKFHQLTTQEVEERRAQLEVYFNGLISWWLEQWTERHDGNSQLTKVIMERELPVLSPCYELSDGAFVCSRDEVESES